jgi:hypothetical protein
VELPSRSWYQISASQRFDPYVLLLGDQCAHTEWISDSTGTSVFFRRAVEREYPSSRCAVVPEYPSPRNAVEQEYRQH